MQELVVLQDSFSSHGTLTCHAVALHLTHFVLSFQRGQQRRTDGNPIHHGAELEDDWLLLQALWQLRELIRLHWRLVDAGGLVGRLRGGCVLSVGRLAEMEEQFRFRIRCRLWLAVIHSLFNCVC